MFLNKILPVTKKYKLLFWLTSYFSNSKNKLRRGFGFHSGVAVRSNVNVISR